MDVLSRINRGEEKEEILQRFLVKVDKTSDCWLWTGEISNKGYGRFRYKGSRVSAHRVSYTLFKGEIRGLCVLHKCDNPRCVNPDHLFLGTHRDNLMDAIKKGRHMVGDKNPCRIHPEIIRRGENHNMAKLNNAEVEYIKKELANGVNITTLSKKFNVSLTTICDIKNGRSWNTIQSSKPLIGRCYSSKYIGVCWDKKNKKWKASIAIGKKKVFQKNFSDEISAALAYDEQALLYGRKLNFPAEKGAV